MKQNISKIGLLLICIIVLSANSCGDKLTKAATFLEQSTNIALTAQNTILSLNATALPDGSKLLSDDETRPLMEGFKKYGLVVKVAITKVRELQAKADSGGLDSSDDAALQAVIQAVSSALNELTVSGAIGIKNPQSQAKVQFYIGQLVQLSNNLLNLF